MFENKCMKTLYVGTCQNDPTKASWVGRAGRIQPRLAGDRGLGWEDLARDSSWIQHLKHLQLFTFLRAEDLDISVLSVMYILW